MQFGIFTIGDIARNPLTGVTPSEADRIDAVVKIATRADEVGLDVFALGEHHNPPFFPSSPTTLLAHIAAQTKRIILSTAVSLISTNDPVRMAEEYAMLQHLAQGRLDLMLGRGNTVPVYSWFGKDIQTGVELSLENYELLHRLWREEVVDWQGRFRTPLERFTSVPRPLDGVPPFIWHGSIRTVEIAEQAAYYGNGFSPTTYWRRTSISCPSSITIANVSNIMAAEHANRAVVGLGGHTYIAKNSQDAYAQFRPFFEGLNIYGKSYDLDQCARDTPLGVGSPQEVINKTLESQRAFGDYQRQLWIIDAMGLPLKAALEQVELLATEVCRSCAVRWAPGVHQARRKHRRMKTL